MGQINIDMLKAVAPRFLTGVLEADAWEGVPNMPKATEASYDDSTGVYTLVMPVDWSHTDNAEIAFTVPAVVESASAVSFAIGSNVYAMETVPSWDVGEVRTLKLLTTTTAEEGMTEYSLLPPFEQTVVVIGMRSDTKGFIGLDDTTDAQYHMACAVSLDIVDHGLDTVTIKAKNGKPSMAIPIKIAVI